MPYTFKSDHAVTIDTFKPAAPKIRVSELDWTDYLIDWSGLRKMTAGASMHVEYRWRYPWNGGHKWTGWNTYNSSIGIGVGGKSNTEYRCAFRAVNVNGTSPEMAGSA